MTNKIVKRMIIFIILLVIIFVAFRIIKVQNMILKKIYPINFQEYVELYAKENNLDKYIIYAMIKAESNFRPDVKSKSNAIGLMQLLENTAVEISNAIENNIVTENSLYEPEINIKLGTSYYAYLLNHYNGNNILALTAYNAGMGNVDRWLEEGIIKKDASDIENIPYKETNNYIRKVIRNYKIYQNLYQK